MPSPIRDHDELLAAIAALPATPPGHVRVFRGQHADYPTMLPSGLRRPLRKETIWRVYAQHLYHDLVPDAFADPDAIVETLRATQVWLEAVAQHYGPGSKYVDVTYSADVALWFALNRIEEVEAEGTIGPPGPPDPERDHPTWGTLLRYVPWEEEGYLYAWDLPLWDRAELAEPGVVVDLAGAPEAFTSSARMRAQHGCVVYCGEDAAAAFDLKAARLPGTPLRVARPMTGAPGLERRVADVFPSPAEDPWYARLLSVPMSYAPTPAPPRLQRAIPVAVYYDERDDRYVREVTYHDVAFGVPLLHRALDVESRPLPVVLEAPLVFPYPPGDSEQWNHALLLADLPDRCDVRELGAGEPAGAVALDDVLFELSLLEHTGWERVVRERADLRMLRAVWLRRPPGGGLFVGYLHHGVHDQTPEFVGFLPVRLDPASRQLVFQAHDGSGPSVPVAHDPAMAKGLLVALMLLRHLSPAPKVEAQPRLEVGTDGGRRILVNVTGEGARLHRVPSPVEDWYVLRAAGNPDEPFTHVRDPLGALQIETRGTFRELDPEELRAAMGP